MNPTTTTPPNNFYACLMTNNDDADEGNDTHQIHHTNLASSAHNGKTYTPPTDYALSDSGASGHFLTASAHAINKTIAATPLVVTLPDGATIFSTHTCNLDMPWLPDSVTEAHIIPGLSHSSLIFGVMDR